MLKKHDNCPYCGARMEEAEDCPLKEIVLCKDCKYKSTNSYAHYNLSGLGRDVRWCVRRECFVGDNDFCSWGKRREE